MRSKAQRQPCSQSRVEPAPIPSPAIPAEVAEVSSTRDQFQCQTRGKADLAEWVGWDKRIVLGVDDEAGQRDPGNLRTRTTACVVIDRAGEAVARRGVLIVKLEQRFDLREI